MITNLSEKLRNLSITLIYINNSDFLFSIPPFKSFIYAQICIKNNFYDLFKISNYQNSEGILYK